ncbi:cytochrome ubiquinol oxidase subunit I [Desulfovibrio litoralis]|uniref:Cytochrome bd terminal oxidase subunit I n=1 Tax=Desulfovibrio litoralis DSM 11393 TaxID=1121455 RepID=A0A1M7S1K9_9BACT|nr:cytochrome ubiquinol oxidase subunit I [Desulfovibrio litoralis]SHN52341.1 Cytochrome bd terminal oxidase subunit I [Desulfovibrio litoralis DSM 11393]
MNYPVWNMPLINGGLLIAIIAVLHIFIAQLAVGGGFFLVMTEAKGHKEQSKEILKWVKGHTKFFILLTMVFGGLSGVGIWFVTALVSPTAVSFLVRNFAYAWASEWAFFLGEIIALLVYSATFQACIDGKLSPQKHMFTGWIYALFAFLSLFAINGIVSFMLTPGDWQNINDFWIGIFNPSFFPALFYRTANSLLLAGVFGLITALYIKDEKTRESMLRWCALWVCVPFFVMFASAFWYATTLPGFEGGFTLPASLLRRTTDVRPFLNIFIFVTPLLLLVGLAIFLFLAKAPKLVRLPLVILIMLISLVQMGSFEWLRETTRRPYVIYGLIYSNDIPVSEAKRMNEQGALSAWANAPNLDTNEGKIKAGHFLFTQQCANCHGFGGPMINIAPRVAGRGVMGIEAQLIGQGKLLTYMPPFLGTDQERHTLAFYLHHLFPNKQQ